MPNTENIARYIYPDDELHQDEFLHQYRLVTTLKKSLLHELLPTLDDSQIAMLVFEQKVQDLHRSIARNCRLRFVREFLYHTRLELLIRHVKGFARHNAKTVATKPINPSQTPPKWGSRKHRHSVLAQYPQLDHATINRIFKTVSQIAENHKKQTAEQAKENQITVR